MDTENRALIFNGFGILASLFILLSGALLSQVMIYLLVQVFGALLMIWAFITIKVHKTSHHLPKGYFYIKTGPYDIIRHPVYAGYLLVMVSFVEIEFTLLRFIALLILVAAIFMKILREENVMSDTISEYSGYKKKTKAIIPYLL